MSSHVQRVRRDRLVTDCKTHHNIDLSAGGSHQHLRGAIDWITAMLAYLDELRMCLTP